MLDSKMLFVTDIDEPVVGARLVGLPLFAGQEAERDERYVAGVGYRHARPRRTASGQRPCSQTAQRLEEDRQLAEAADAQPADE